MFAYVKILIYLCAKIRICTIMSISIISTKEVTKPLKATLQASGKLGFTRDTADLLRLESGKKIQIGKDDDNDDLYMIIPSAPVEEAFTVAKAGDYFYLPTTQMFDTMEKYNYKIQTFMFDLVRRKELDGQLNGTVYFMKERATYKSVPRES